jgi:hypothetical protein
VNFPRGETQGSSEEPKRAVCWSRVNGEARQKFQECFRLDWRWLSDSRGTGVHPINGLMFAKMRTPSFRAGNPDNVCVEIFHKERGRIDRMVWRVGAKGWTDELRSEVESFVEIYRSR